MTNRTKFLALSLIASLNISSGYDSSNINTYAKEIYVNKSKDENSLKIISELPKDFHKEYFNYIVREKVRDMSVYFNNIPEEWLYKVFYIECHGNPYAVNNLSEASGLIQFMPETAKRLGTTVNSIQNMDIIQQLDLVKLYLERINPSKKFNSFTDLYLAVFFPIAIGKSDSYVLGSHRDEAYINKISTQNPAVDVNSDGRINKEEFKHFAESKC